MSGCDTPLNPLERDGSNRNERLVAALDPASAPVDERDVAEWLLYARQLAEQIKFFPLPPETATDLDWYRFIDNDISTLVAHIGAYEVDRWREDIVMLAGRVGSNGDSQQGLADLLQPVFSAVDEIDGWYRRSIEGLQLHARLDRFIRGSLAEALGEAWSYGLRLEALGVADVVPTEHPGGPWRGDGEQPVPDLTFLRGNDPAEVADATQRVVRVSDRFHAVLRTLRDESPDHLRQTLEEYPGHQPHLALYLAFLVLLRHARDRVNESTAKHLDFYYRDVLQIGAEAAVPDQAHVVFELARDAEPHRVEAGTALKAGKDSGGNDVTFVTESELTVNRAQVDELKTVYLDMDASGTVTNIHAAGTADSGDGQGAEIDREDGGWDMLGSSSMPYGTVGFAVAAPVLLLGQGSRTVTVVLHTRHTGAALSADDAEVAADELRDNVTVWASGEEAWVRATTDRVEVADVAAGRRTITFVLSFARDADPVVPYDDEVLEDGFDTSQPLLKFVVDNDGLAAEGGIRLADRSTMDTFSDATTKYQRGAIVRHQGKIYRALATYVGAGFRPPNNPNTWQHLRPSYAYRHLRGLVVETIEISVLVDGVTDVLLENDTGVLDPAKPFNPFGTVPRKGSSFLIGSREVFQKQLTRLDLELTWSGLPENGFETHYAGYAGTPPVNGNQHFTARFEILDGGDWKPAADSTPLFDAAAGDATRTITLGGNPIAPLTTATAGIDELEGYGPNVQRGYLRARLDRDFLHARYVPTATGAAYTLTGNVGVEKPDGTTGTLTSGDVAIVPPALPPNAPYTPLVEQLSLRYLADQRIDLTKPRASGRAGGAEASVFQIWPFGTRCLVPGTNDRLLPEFEVSVRYEGGTTLSTTASGTLYVGLKDLDADNRPNLSLLIQVAEGTADPTLRPPPVAWSYLADDSWVDFAPNEILADGTANLTTSGIVSFSVPAAMTSDNSVMPDGLHWIKASVDRNAAGMVKAVALHAQAVTAAFADQGNVDDRVATPLPAETIDKLVRRRAAIKTVSQPAASFGGRVAEADADYRTRVSERLRHKHRAVTIFDYERIVLEEFPEVYKVRCLNHTDAGSEYAPGKVRLVVVPDLREKSAVDPLRPRVSVGTLGRIERHVRDLASDFAEIEVTNPDYEEVRARFRVRFKAGFDIGYYTKKINDDIIDLLSPWRHGDSTDLSFGGRIHRSWLIDEIEDFEYVDFLADFKIDHVVDPGTGSTLTDVEEAKATRSSTVLVSARNHQVTHDLVSCHDDDADRLPPAPSTGPKPLHDEPGLRYLGNASERELHDRWNLTVGCQIDEIGVDRRYFFATVEDSEPFGYDLCAYCSGMMASDRLTAPPDDLAEPPTAASPGTAPTPPPDPAPGLRYLGNATSRELHDRWDLTRACHVDEIAVDRRYYFATIEETEREGYDFCAHCFGRARSRR